jgi:hypothetical protein
VLEVSVENVGLGCPEEDLLPANLMSEPFNRSGKENSREEPS